MLGDKNGIRENMIEDVGEINVIIGIGKEFTNPVMENKKRIANEIPPLVGEVIHHNTRRE